MTGTYNEIRCPKCEVSIFVYADQAGDQIRCPRCQNEILVPGTKPTSPSEHSVEDLIELESDENPLLEDVSSSPPSNEAPITSDKTNVSEDWPDELRLAADPEDEKNEDHSEAALDFNQGLVDQTAEDSDDDLGELISNPETKPVVETKNAFEVDENSPLEVAGVTPADGQFGVTCHLCGSLLYGRVSQVGTKIKCHDCHSMVEVPQPKAKPAPVSEEQVETQKDEEAGYRLSEPVDLQPLDTTFDITLGEIDYEDDEFFEQRRQADEQADALPNANLADQDSEKNIPGIDQAISVELPTELPVPKKERFKGQPVKHDSDDDDDDEYNLLPVAEKSSPGAVAWGPQTSNISEPLSIDEKEEPQKKKEPPKIPQPKKQSAPKSNQQSQSDSEDIPGPLVDLADWLKEAIFPLKDKNGLLKIGLATILIGCCYLLILGGCASFTEESKTIEKFVGFAFVAMGGVPLCLTLFVMGVYSNSVIRVGMEGKGTLAEWPDFSIADWTSQFVFVGTSFWISAVPGVILGTLFSLITQSSFWLYSGIIFSTLTLTPFVLASVVFNGSPAAVMTPAVFQSFQVMKNRWLRFLGFALAVGLLLSLSIVVLSFLVLGMRPLAFFIAAVQVSALFTYWWVLGKHLGHVVRWLSSDSA